MLIATRNSSLGAAFCMPLREQPENAGSSASSASRLRSRRNAAELRVHVGIVAVEPVAEAASYEFDGGHRRRALHDVVLAVEEVGGILRVRRHRLEAGERTE